MIKKAALYVVPTPLGNLNDISTRAKEVLAKAHTIAAEDTRHTRHLLAHLGLNVPLLAAHEHNEEEAAQTILQHLANGHSIALVSDAGTPAISDPGARIVARVHEAGFAVIPLPGPCAATTALSASGFLNPHFLFYGFLPAKLKAKEEALKALENLPYTLIFYEAPHSILETVDVFATLFGESRKFVLARELTKIYETIHVATPKAMQVWLKEDDNRQRGEFVLILEGGAKNKADYEASRVIQLLLAENLPIKQIARIVSGITGESKNALYELALTLREK